LAQSGREEKKERERYLGGWNERKREREREREREVQKPGRGVVRVYGNEQVEALGSLTPM
jgi:hypothetical protein